MKETWRGQVRIAKSKKKKNIFNGWTSTQSISPTSVTQLPCISATCDIWTNNEQWALCFSSYQIAICCLHTSVLWGIQRLPPTLIMNLEFVLPGSLTMALKGKANPVGFGKEWREEKEGEEKKNLHRDQSLLLSGSLAALEQMGVGGTMSPLRFRIQSGCCCSVHTGRWRLCVRGLAICILLASRGREGCGLLLLLLLLLTCLFFTFLISSRECKSKAPRQSGRVEQELV